MHEILSDKLRPYFAFKFVGSCEIYIRFQRFKLVSVKLMAIQGTNEHLPPPCPVEPPIDGRLLGPHQFLEYRQRLATVVTDFKTR